MRNNDLLAACLVALAAVAVGFLSRGSVNLLLTTLSLPLVLFVPGYTLSAALVPGGRTGLAERVALSIGLSIGVAVLGGLLLNLLPSGITPAAWRVLLLGVTLTAAGYALWRRVHGRIPGPGPLATQISVREAALISSAALLIGLALGLGSLGLDPVTQAPRGSAEAQLTQFWAVKSAPASQHVVRIGLRNYEGESMTYRVTLEGANRLLAEWPQITLASGAKWEIEVALPPDLAQQEVTATAFRVGDAQPYRWVHLAAGGGG